MGLAHLADEVGHELEVAQRVRQYPVESSEDRLPFRLGRFELSTDGEVCESADDELSDMEMIPEEMLSDLFDVRVRTSLPGEFVSDNANEVTEEGKLICVSTPLAEEQVLSRRCQRCLGGRGWCGCWVGGTAWRRPPRAWSPSAA